MGVEWPDRREDVLNALDILASPNPSAEWPTLTEAVHWLVDDTFWDVRDPKEDIGALLVDEHEAAAVRSVVSAVGAVAERQGPTASDQAWLDDFSWPIVRKLAARTATAMRGFGGDAVGRRLRAVERLAWTDPDGRYEVQQAGGQTILEYWIPAEDLDEFNRHIVGRIEVLREFR